MAINNLSPINAQFIKKLNKEHTKAPQTHSPSEPIKEESTQKAPNNRKIFIAAAAAIVSAVTIAAILAGRKKLNPPSVKPVQPGAEKVSSAAQSAKKPAAVAPLEETVAQSSKKSAKKVCMPDDKIIRQFEAEKANVQKIYENMPALRDDSIYQQKYAEVKALLEKGRESNYEKVVDEKTGKVIRSYSISDRDFTPTVAMQEYQDGVMVRETSYYAGNGFNSIVEYAKDGTKTKLQIFDTDNPSKGAVDMLVFEEAADKGIIRDVYYFGGNSVHYSKFLIPKEGPEQGISEQLMRIHYILNPCGPKADCEVAYICSNKNKIVFNCEDGQLKSYELL